MCHKQRIWYNISHYGPILTLYDIGIGGMEWWPKSDLIVENDIIYIMVYLCSRRCTSTWLREKHNGSSGRSLVRICFFVLATHSNSLWYFSFVLSHYAWFPASVDYHISQYCIPRMHDCIDSACSPWSTDTEGSTKFLWTHRRKPCQCPAGMLLVCMSSMITPT